jgi:cytochrome c biogenesis protein
MATVEEPATQGPVRPEPPPAPPALGPVAMARWAWRQLTSMRVALILLFGLAVASIPGSLIPQNSVDPLVVSEFRKRNPELSQWYDRFALFDVFSSPWFSAIYLLLMVSLVGCLVPRSRLYWRAMRSKPPAAPRHLDRLPEHRRVVLDADPQAVLTAAQAHLRGRRFRLVRAPDSLAAQRGYLHDTGNLVFHMSLLVLLGGVALGHLYNLDGRALVVEGEGFANTVTQYDNLSAGPRYDVAKLHPFAVQLDDFVAEYEQDGPQAGAARDFAAHVTFRADPAAEPEQRTIKVNHPLAAEGAKVFLGAHGYAPVVTVKDGNGDVAFRGPVPFLPVDPVGLTSRGVVKVPDAAPAQLGFQGFFLPDAAFAMDRGPYSQFPEPRNPRLVLNAWAGDLGLDAGVPQSIYKLVTDGLTQIRESDAPDAEPFTESLAVGETMTLPGDRGSLTFDGYREWVVLEIAHNPGNRIALAGAVLALAGLLGSLFVRPRRVWVRALPLDDGRDEGGRTVVAVGALATSDGPDLAEEVDRLLAAIGGGTGTGSGGPAGAPAKE